MFGGDAVIVSVLNLENHLNQLSSLEYFKKQ